MDESAATPASEMMKDDRIDMLTDALRQIDAMSRAYPEAVFPPPDLERARTLLAVGGMSLDVVSADAMRHALSTVGEIARKALAAAEGT